jgi:uncharacterized membrane protein
MRPRWEIKDRAKFQFRQRYGLCIGATLLFTILVAAQGFSFQFSYHQNFSLGSDYWQIIYPILITVAVLGTLLSIFVSGPVTVGYAKFASCIFVGVYTGVDDMFRTGFRQNYWRSVGGMLWMNLFIFLWSLLLIIPGIIKTYAYFATPYLLAEFPNVSATDALKISMRMTDGYKGDIFVMSLSFIGWNILSAFTFGLLGILYVNPYYYTSMAGMYQELKMIALGRGTVRYEELMGYPAPGYAEGAY